MMGIPPNIPPGSTPPSSGRSSESERGRPKKDFKLPQRKGKEGKKEKKSLFDLSKEEKKQELHEENKVEAISQQQLQQQELEASFKVEGQDAISSVEAKQEIAKVAELIQRMVAQMRVGMVGGKDFASLDLKNTADVPSFLTNTTLTLAQTEKGLVIHFTNFDTPQQQALAIRAIEQNKQELTQLLTNLQAKNIAVAEMQIGNHTVALPRVEPLPPPYKIGPVRTETEGQRREQEREEGGAGPEPR